MDRRKFIAGVGTLTVGLAGCTGDSGEGTTTGSGGGSTSTGTGASTTAGGAETTAGGDETTDSAETTEEGSSGSYSVSMPPVGEVSFDGVPETWVANNGSWADMGVALGVEPPKAVWMTSRYHTRYYDEIPGVSVDKSGMQSLYDGGVSKERFYELDADVHVVDPNFLMNRFKGWEQADVDEVREEIAPFFGNSIFSRGYEWHEDYEYFTLYEAFEKLSQLFRREDRYEQFAAIHDEMQSRLSEVVPSKKSERPSVAVFWASGDQPEEFLPYLVDKGTSFKQWRDLRVNDALANTDVRNFHSSRAAVDYETLLEIDPEVLLLRGHESQTAREFQNTVVQYLKDHETASALTAVQNGDVYRGGPLYQGPITNLVLTQRAASQVYSDALGDTKLYDAEKVSSVVDGSN
ncbi:ABC transporter substrate-binding protein [Halobium palmae]|uniref:ABC transporter substrate-binding protein n=1 Tax=Halobium palmae TaxID=1776492 RepID=A0ABD5RYH2_9EURY